MTEIPCKKCWKIITKKWPRIYCIKCRCEVDKEIAKAYREKNIDKIRERGRKYGREKREALKWEE